MYEFAQLGWPVSRCTKRCETAHLAAFQRRLTVARTYDIIPIVCIACAHVLQRSKGAVHMQKPRPKEAPAPRQQRPTRENRGSNKGASAPFVIPEGEKAAETPAPSVSETLAKQADTDPGVIRNEASSRPESWEAIRGRRPCDRS